ncbi:MAG: TolB family protein [Muribaculaceae bacterium]
MKITNLAISAFCICGLLSITSCNKKTYEAAFSPEESGLGIVKITDESKDAVVHPKVGGLSVNPVTASSGLNGKCTWASIRTLSVSPDGKELAYLGLQNKQHNVMVRRSTSAGAATQRTFRNVGTCFWGIDDNLYYSDYTETTSKICSVNSHAGTLIHQHTSNNFDFNPVLSRNGEILYFERVEAGVGSCIWSYKLETGELANCGSGYSPCPLGDGTQEFLCVRNTSNGNSEIWRVNYVTGQEQLIITDKEHGYSDPQISPDGKWILFTGNSVSPVNKKKNVDIFVCRLDGSNFMQLTYHPADDLCPQWGADGKSIYFISDRSSKNFNVWRMNFNLR